MVKPVLLAVDDDISVLRAVERDLRRHYGSHFRILAVDSGRAALDALIQLKRRNEPVALLIADQRMPQMNGIEFLDQSRQYFPDAKRILLTAYADTDAAIQAINSVRLDYYLLKPWTPPEEHLYPVLDDVLDDWQATFRPPFEGVRVLGHRWSPASHQMKVFLSRSLVPYEWYDIETTEAGRHLLSQIDPEPTQLPVLMFQDGTILQAPTVMEMATKIGLRTQANLPFYDLIIVGGGPAGLAAAVYSASEGLYTAMIEREAPGGQMGTTSRIENYLGFPVGLSGGDLARRAVAQARRFGVEILAPQEVVALRVADTYRIVTLSDGTELSCRALLISTGVSYRKLNVPGLESFNGAGVYYGAALTEALSCSGEDVYFIGGANSAGQAALYFARYARKVTMLVRAPSLAQSMSRYLIDEIEAAHNIEVQPYSVVSGVQGTDHLEVITITNTQTGEQRTMPTKSLCIFIGAQPSTDWVSGLLELDEHGFILAGHDLIRNGQRPANWSMKRDPMLLETCVPGIFVAGDVRHGSVKRVASGVGEGSIAVQLIHQYLNEGQANVL